MLRLSRLFPMLRTIGGGGANMAQTEYLRKWRLVARGIHRQPPCSGCGILPGSLLSLEGLITSTLRMP